MKIIKIYFFISLLISFMIIYITEPEAHIIIKNKLSKRDGNIKFLDNDGNCYNYKKKNIMCPFDTSIIKNL